MNNKEAYIKKFEAQLDEWKADITKLRAKADKADAEMQIKYNEQIDQIHEKEKQAQAQLASMKKAGEDSWEDLKAGLEQAGNSLKEAFSSIKSNFK